MNLRGCYEEHDQGEAAGAAPAPADAFVHRAGASTQRAHVAGWSRTLSAFRTPATARASWELAVSALPFAAGWFAMQWAVSHGAYWLYALLMLPTAGFLVRLFLIQHDCGHRAFYPNRRANDWTGRAISVLTLTPYDHWRRTHAIHHATHGNLARRGVGDVDTLTVAEYYARPRATRLRYRAYRHPLVLFVIGPIYVFVVSNRFPGGFTRDGWRPWLSTMATNAGIVLVCALAIALVGPRTFMLVHLPLMFLAALAGVYLFYVQHQFEHAYWQQPAAWHVREGALQGSSHFDLPLVLRWFTANIGVHHVHHLASTIPFYRLQTVLRTHPELADVNRIGLLESLRCVRLALWDEGERRMVSFAEAARLARVRTGLANEGVALPH